MSWQELFAITINHGYIPQIFLAELIFFLHMAFYGQLAFGTVQFPAKAFQVTDASLQERSARLRLSAAFFCVATDR